MKADRTPAPLDPRRMWPDAKAGEDQPFGPRTLQRGEPVIEAAIRKARNKSGGDVKAARGRLLLYARRDTILTRELVRKAIWQATFSVAVAGEYPAAVPLDTDPHPFTAGQFAEMRAVVQKAANGALSAKDGDVAAARMLLWQDATEREELSGALSGLLILALR